MHHCRDEPFFRGKYSFQKVTGNNILYKFSMLNILYEKNTLFSLNQSLFFSFFQCIETSISETFESMSGTPMNESSLLINNEAKNRKT